MLNMRCAKDEENNGTTTGHILHGFQSSATTTYAERWY